MKSRPMDGKIAERCRDGSQAMVMTLRQYREYLLQSLKAEKEGVKRTREQEQAWEEHRKKHKQDVEYQRMFPKLEQSYSSLSADLMFWLAILPQAAAIIAVMVLMASSGQANDMCGEEHAARTRNCFASPDFNTHFECYKQSLSTLAQCVEASKAKGEDAQIAKQPLTDGDAAPRSPQ